MYFLRRYYTLVACFIFFILFCFLQPVHALDTTDLPFQIKLDYCVNQKASASELIIKAIVILDEGYHVYAHAEKESLPTTLVLQSATGEPITGYIYYPQGEPYEDASGRGKTIGVYTGEFPVFIQTSMDVLEKNPVLDISFLLCSAKHCIPINETASIKPPKNIPPLSSVSWEEEFLLYKDFYVPEDSEKELKSEIHESLDEGTELVLEPRYLQENFEPTRIEIALLFGFLAGLILNIMPCVLPVLTLKFSFLLSHINKQNEESSFRSIRIQNIFFSLGIISWFFLLALCMEVLGLAWGGFFQSIPIIFSLIIIIFVLSLSLFDVFTLPVIDFKINTDSHPYIQSYFTGLMTTLLATPCSGPLLGGVLGWAALQPLYIIFIVFLATSLGMSLPYIIFAIYPKALSFLPKPGAWCVKVERIVGFFLLGTIIYLLSILPGYMLPATLTTLLITAVAAWLWGNWGGLTASITRKLFVGGFAILVVSLSILWSFQPQIETDWHLYSKECFQRYLGKRPILLEFTADWCPTCKLLEKTVLTQDFLEDLVEQYDLVLIKVDLTSKSPDEEALLRALGSVSIPMTAIFPFGDNANQPLVLRDLYTSEQLEHALKVTLDQN